jgi:hypothetical protein
VLAFEYFGAVPGRIRYDNLKPAVARVLRGRDRTEAERFIALRSHYGFGFFFFCMPGHAGPHEKRGSAAPTWSRPLGTIAGRGEPADRSRPKSSMAGG